MQSQFLKLKTCPECKVEEVIKPVDFQELLIDGAKGKEEHLEDLLVRYPGFLNYGAYVQGVNGVAVF